MCGDAAANHGRNVFFHPPTRHRERTDASNQHLATREKADDTETHQQHLRGLQADREHYDRCHQIQRCHCAVHTVTHGCLVAFAADRATAQPHRTGGDHHQICEKGRHAGISAHADDGRHRHRRHDDAEHRDHVGFPGPHMQRRTFFRQCGDPERDQRDQPAETVDEKQKLVCGIHGVAPLCVCVDDGCSLRSASDVRHMPVVTRKG